MPQDVTDLKKQYRTVVEGNFPDSFGLALVKESPLRYGENPNQPAATYRLQGTTLPELTNIRLAKSGKGGLSATNLMDVTRALDILKFFKKPSVSVMKHTIPSGFATQYQDESLVETYTKARDADARSAFGSIVAFNVPVDKATAEELAASYVEGVAAPSYDDDALAILEEKKNMRLMLFDNLDAIPKFVGDDVKGLYDLKALPTGRVILQVPYLSKIASKDDLIISPQITNKEEESVSIEREPTEQEMEDLLTAWYVNIGVRSNGIVIVKNGVTLAVGSGQQERVGAVEQAIVKAYQKAMDREGIKYDPLQAMASKKKLSEDPLQGAVLSSDAFFPFPDSIELIAGNGMTAIIQPGGSVKDFDVVKAANEKKLAMVFTTERCFGHF